MKTEEKYYYLEHDYRDSQTNTKIEAGEPFRVVEILDGKVSIETESGIKWPFMSVEVFACLAFHYEFKEESQ